MTARRLMAVLAHPDDESLGFGGTLAKYAAEGVEVFLVTATRGDAGRYRGVRPGETGHPGADALAQIREEELRGAAAELGVREVTVLPYGDQRLDSASPREAAGAIAREIRRVRPDVVVTFGPDGAYGHPDHIAISQFTTAAVVAAADAHTVAKLYYLAWPEDAWGAYEAAFRKLSSLVDGVERQAVPWPEWMITTTIDTSAYWPAVWRAVSRHESQVSAYAPLARLSPDQHRALWGRQAFYRVFSTVNGGRARETDLFTGLEGVQR